MPCLFFSLNGKNNKMNLAKLFAEWRAKVIAKKWGMEWAKIQSKIDKLDNTDLWTIDWVGDSTVKLLLENWISSLEEMKEYWVDKLEQLKLNPFSFKAIKKFLKDN